MGIIKNIKRWFGMIFASKAKEVFNVTNSVSTKMERFVNKCANIYIGKPEWVSEENNVKTINFAKTICSEVARLTMLGTKITVDGSKRADYLQEELDKIYYQLRKWVEYGAAYGTIVLKPTENGIGVWLPGEFIAVSEKDGRIDSAIFINRQYDEQNKKHYTRLEYHRFIDDLYVITNKCYVGDSKDEMENEIDIKNTPWSLLDEEAYISGIETPLFGVLNMPGANNIDINGATSMPIFAEAIEELKDLDVAYSRNAQEIFDSEKIIFMDTDRLMTAGTRLTGPNGLEVAKRKSKLPHYVQFVEGMDSGEIYHEVQPSMFPEERKAEINQQLSLIGFKCGFSNGYFVLDEKTGMITATQVEADDRRTIQTIKDVRDQLEMCLKNLIDAINAFTDLYTDLPAGNYEVTFDFGDITFNAEEDRARALTLTNSGYYPKWYYLHKYEGLSEEEAKELTTEAMIPMMGGLFPE